MGDTGPYAGWVLNYVRKEEQSKEPRLILSLFLTVDKIVTCDGETNNPSLLLFFVRGFVPGIEKKLRQRPTCKLSAM